MKVKISIFLLLLTSLGSYAQNLKLEDIFSNKYSQYGFQGVNWYKTNDNYTEYNELNDGWELLLKSIKSEKVIKKLIESKNFKLDSNFKSIDEYSFSPDYNFLLIKTETQNIYRYSNTAKFCLININTRSTKIFDSEKISLPTFSPDSKKIAYSKKNNLYIYNIENHEITQITNDGKFNSIINGTGDWVYEEEFETIKAFEWDDKSTKIGFLKFDETDVPLYNMQIWKTPYPESYSFKYPKVGEKNAKVSVHIFDLDSKSSKTVFSPQQDLYIPRIQWFNSNLIFHTLNRNQDSLTIIAYDGQTISHIYSESSNTYVEITPNWIYNIKSNIGYFTSEKSGFNHIYKINLSDNKVEQITTGDWEVTGILDYDDVSEKLYFSSKAYSVLENHFYVVDKNKTIKKLTSEEGKHNISISPSKKYFIDEVNALQGITVYLKDINGGIINRIDNNEPTQKLLKENVKSTISFNQFVSKSSEKLNYYLIKPSNFDSTKKYPVLMFVYGGPGSQEVEKDNLGRNKLWFDYLAQNGYLVACVDNRGTGGRGKTFRDCTTKKLGEKETEDQIDFAKYLGTKSYIDAARIGIFGWSYGGYMSSLCILLGNDVFKSAIAVAPVTSWRFYDSIYTERYLKNPIDNASGYDNTAPINLANRLKGNFLLIHGTGDDNVHFQNAIEMQRALIKAGKQFDSFYYPDKNHGIYGGNTRLHLYQMMTNFILNKL